MDVPKIEYVNTDDGIRIAYQVFGDGPPAVFVPTAASAIEAFWVPTLVRVWERMAVNLRLAMFDHRGSGLSDGFDAPPTLADRSLDIKAVMDATGMDEASLTGFEFGATVAVAFAAEYPERVDRVVLYNARVGRSARAMADELAPNAPEPLPSFRSKDNLAGLDLVGVEIDEDLALYLNPSLASHPEVLDQLVTYERMAGSRSAQRRQVTSVSSGRSTKLL